MGKKIPNHVAIIMDGNGRWARKRLLPRSLGHKRGMERVEPVLEHARKLGIKVLSLFAFSTENWKRSQKEVEFLFSHFQDYLKKKKPELMKNKVRLNVMGSRAGLPDSLISVIDEVTEATKGNKNITLNIVFNYGGRAEIVEAAKRVISDFKNKGLGSKKLTEEVFGEYLYSPFVGDVDLLVRTSGEERISNFLLWRVAYAELYFTKTLWPDFGPRGLDKAVGEFSKRDRKFGGR